MPDPDTTRSTLFPKGMALERAFAKAGGLLIAGTDPTGGIRKVEIVFRQGVGYDPAKLIASVSGKAGIW